MYKECQTSETFLYSFNCQIPVYVDKEIPNLFDTEAFPSEYPGNLYQEVIPCLTSGDESINNQNINTN